MDFVEIFWINPGFLDLDLDTDPQIFSGFCNEISGWVGRGPKNSQLDFGLDPDCDQDPEVFCVKDSLFSIALCIDSLE